MKRVTTPLDISKISLARKVGRTDIPAPDQEIEGWPKALRHHANGKLVCGLLRIRLAPDSAWLSTRVNTTTTTVVRYWISAEQSLPSDHVGPTPRPS